MNLDRMFILLNGMSYGPGITERSLATVKLFFLAFHIKPISLLGTTNPYETKNFFNQCLFFWIRNILQNWHIRCTLVWNRKYKLLGNDNLECARCFLTGCRVWLFSPYSRRWYSCQEFCPQAGWESSRRVWLMAPTAQTTDSFTI